MSYSFWSLSAIAVTTCTLLGCASAPPPTPSPEPISAPVRSPLEYGQLVAVEEDDLSFQRGEALESAARRYTEEVSALIESRQDDFTACYLKELKKNPDLAGQLNISATVVSGGSLKNKPSFAINTLHNTRVETCIIGIFQTIPFPEPFNNDYADVKYLFQFGVF